MAWVVGRVADWFWRGSALAENAKAPNAPHTRTKELARRAAASAAMARSALTPTEALKEPDNAIASELFRQSAYWSACALALRSDSQPVGDRQYDVSVWNTLDLGSFSEAIESNADTEAMRVNLASGSFVRFAELSANQQVGSRIDLQRLAETLLARVEANFSASSDLHRQRAWRMGTLLVVLLAIGFGSVELRRYRELRSDLLAGKPWQTSSSNGGGCASPAQSCPEAVGFFFHTEVDDRSPWLSFDLGSSQAISGVEIDNRKDCCSERTIHLVVEVSGDGAKWTTVARREETFTNWHAWFATVHARWLRVRIDAPGTLHLSRVRAYP